MAVASGQDIKDELTPGGEVSMNVWRCIQHMLHEKDNGIYGEWLDRFRGLFDPHFVVSHNICESVDKQLMLETLNVWLGTED